jgi:hypothetical protein
MSNKSINNRLMKHCQRSKESYFEQYRDYVYNGESGRYIYIKRGGSLLAVAHLDCVKEDNIQSSIIRYPDSLEGIGVNSLALGDRLGVYIITELLPKFGVTNYDILLTENEEIGYSSAIEFNTDIEYNWMFEFDRHGTGTAVMYRYDNPEIVGKLRTHGIFREYGSFSDISFLEGLGITGVNFGCGYNLEHSEDCHVFKDDILICVKGFVSFWKQYHNEKMPYTFKPVARYNYNNFNYGKNDGYYLNDNFNEDDDTLPYSARKVSSCYSCGVEFSEDDLMDGICQDCEAWLIDKS